MQDKYVGDVGDYGKYGMLNKIVKLSHGHMRLGVNWYYTRIEEPGIIDGRFTDYLKDSHKDSAKYKVCFPDLYEQLGKLVFPPENENKRTIRHVEANNILPRETIFFSEELPVSGKKNPDRIHDRKEWFERSLEILAPADIIFLDPDNGINPHVKSKGQVKAVKYVFLDEIEAYFKKGKSLIIYNHKDMSPRPRYDAKLLLARQYIRAEDDIRILRFNRFTVRDYVFLIQERHKQVMASLFDHLAKPPYDFLCIPYLPEE